MARPREHSTVWWGNILTTWDNHFFAYHSKKDIVRAVKESGYGPSVTSLYRMFPSKKHNGVFTEYEIKEILRGVSIMSEEWDKAIEILSKSILVPTKIRIILRQIIATENQKDTYRQQQQPEHQDISCGMVPLISTATTLKLSLNEEDLFKPPKKGKHNSAQATSSIVQDTSMLPPPQPRRSERLKGQQSQRRGVTRSWFDNVLEMSYLHDQHLVDAIIWWESAPSAASNIMNLLTWIQRNTKNGSKSWNREHVKSWRIRRCRS